MLPLTRKGAASPTFVLLHFFGGSQREWSATTTILAAHHECITMDLPGFGDAASISGYSVREMLDRVLETIRSLELSRFILVGHSMSGKVALSLAALGEPGLVGLILVAPSPPSPEPIEEKNRQKMLGFGRNRADAENYLDGITAKPLVGEVREHAIQDFLRSSPEAWSAWLECGSREDWSKEVGVVECPALIITGETDQSLSASVQEKLTLPHLRHAAIQMISECGHLPMMEAPDKIASSIKQFVDQVCPDCTAKPIGSEKRG